MLLSDGENSPEKSHAGTPVSGEAPIRWPVPRPRGGPKIEERALLPWSMENQEPELGLEDDFTAEEMELERHVEQALSELEAADAAVEALRMQLETSTEDLTKHREDIETLSGVEQGWEEAKLKSKEALARRRRTLQRSEDEAAQGATSPSARRDARDDQRLELNAARLQNLESQTARLQEQILGQQAAWKLRGEERQRLEHEFETLNGERATMRENQRASRTDVKTLEATVREREEAEAAAVKRRQALERQVTHLRGEVMGLSARAASAAPAAPGSARAGSRPSSARQRSAASSRQSSARGARSPEAQEAPEERTRSARSPERPERPRTQGVELWRQLPEADVEALPDEGPKETCLRLQHDIVALLIKLGRCPPHPLPAPATAAAAEPGAWWKAKPAAAATSSNGVAADQTPTPSAQAAA